MHRIKAHVKKHAKRVKSVLEISEHGHRKLHTPVDHHVSWVSIGVTTIVFTLLINGALAQIATTDPAPTNEQLAPTTQTAPQQPTDTTSPNSSLQPMDPANYNPPPSCAPGTQCPTSPDGYAPQPPPPQNCEPGSTQCSGSYNQGGYTGGSNDQQQIDEQQRQIMDQKRFEMMKKDLSRLTKEMNRIRTQIKSYQKKGVAIPDELTQAVAQMDEFAAKVKAATSAEDLDDVMMNLQEPSETIREWMQKLPRLAMMPKLFKQADKEIARAEKTYASDARKVKASKIELDQPLSEFRAAIDQHKSLLSEIKEQAKTDPEEAMDRLGSDFFETLDNMWENEKIIQVSLNIKRGITTMTREMKEADKIIANLKRKKLDTSELQQILATAKSQLNELKTLASAKPIDTDTVIDAVDSLMETKQAFADKVQELTGENDYMPAMPQASQGPNSGFNLPQGYMTTGPDSGMGGPTGGPENGGFYGNPMPARN